MRSLSNNCQKWFVQKFIIASFIIECPSSEQHVTNVGGDLIFADPLNGISSATFYNWKAKYTGMQSSDVKRLRDLEEATRRLKKMFDELLLDHQILKEIIEKSSECHQTARASQDIQCIYEVSERQACRIIPISRSVVRY